MRTGAFIMCLLCSRLESKLVSCYHTEPAFGHLLCVVTRLPWSVERQCLALSCQPLDFSWPRMWTWPLVSNDRAHPSPETKIKNKKKYSGCSWIWQTSRSIYRVAQVVAANHTYRGCRAIKIKAFFTMTFLDSSLCNGNKSL